MGVQILLAAIAIIVLWLNARATKAVLADDLSERVQRCLQLLMVWILPLAGAIIVLSVHRNQEKPSGKYRKESGEIDDIEDLDTGIASTADASSAD